MWFPNSGGNFLLVTNIQKLRNCKQKSPDFLFLLPLKSGSIGPTFSQVNKEREGLPLPHLDVYLGPWRYLNLQTQL